MDDQAVVDAYRAAARGEARRGAWELMQARRRALRAARRVRSCAAMADAQAEAPDPTHGGAS